MNIKKHTLALAILMIVSFFSVPGGMAATGIVLQQSSLKYLGAFRVPGGNFGCSDETRCSFNYGGGPIGYNPLHNSLFMAGHIHNQWVAEIGIPPLVNSNNLADLNTAAVLQSFADLSAGQKNKITASGASIGNGAQLGGFLLNGNRLLVSVYAFYDGDHEAVYTHFTANADWSRDGVGFSGLKTVGGAQVPQAGYVAGYMTKIPSVWQPEFGGPALTGQSNIPIIGRTSLGPAAFVFDPSQVGVKNPVPAKALVYYPSSHMTLGDYAKANPNISQSSEITGVVFPEGSQSILFFGRHGLGACYGTGEECNDPCDDTKGTHGYPYVHQIWAYKANALLAVKNGSRDPWEIFPYGVWTYELPFQQCGRNLLGAAYDPATQRIYLSQSDADGDLPVVQVFQLQLEPADGTPTPVDKHPAPPTGLKIIQ
jgi:hypothetical protein